MLIALFAHAQSFEHCCRRLRPHPRLCVTPVPFDYPDYVLNSRSQRLSLLVAHTPCGLSCLADLRCRVLTHQSLCGKCIELVARHIAPPSSMEAATEVCRPSYILTSCHVLHPMQCQLNAAPLRSVVTRGAVCWRSTRTYAPTSLQFCAFALQPDCCICIARNDCVVVLVSLPLHVWCCHSDL